MLRCIVGPVGRSDRYGEGGGLVDFMHSWLRGTASHKLAVVHEREVKQKKKLNETKEGNDAIKRGRGHCLDRLEAFYSNTLSNNVSWEHAPLLGRLNL